MPAFHYPDHHHRHAGISFFESLFKLVLGQAQARPRNLAGGPWVLSSPTRAVFWLARPSPNLNNGFRAEKSVKKWQKLAQNRPKSAARTDPRPEIIGPTWTKSKMAQPDLGQKKKVARPSPSLNLQRNCPQGMEGSHSVNSGPGFSGVVSSIMRGPQWIKIRKKKSILEINSKFPFRCIFIFQFFSSSSPAIFQGKRNISQLEFFNIV